MLSIILIKLGHSYWVKRKLKKVRLLVLAENKKSKRLSSYLHMVRKREILLKRKTVIKTSIYSKIMRKRNATK